MTKIIASATSTITKYFLTIEGDTTTDCSCPDHKYRHHTCKHMVAFNGEVQRAATFQALMARFDVRSEVQKAARRERYCIEFNIY